MLKNILTLLIISLHSLLFAQTSPPLSWKTQVYDFGVIIEGMSCTANYIFTNTGNRPLIIDNVRTNCSCIVPYWENIAIEPNQTGVLQIVFEIDKPGIFNKGIFVTFKGYKTSETLQMKATTDNIEYSLLSKKNGEEEKIDLPKINQQGGSATPPGLRNNADISDLVPGQPNRSKPTLAPVEEDLPDLPDMQTKKIKEQEYSKEYPYMTVREQLMIEEINQLRSNPIDYIPFIKTYIESMQQEIINDASMSVMYEDEISSAYELINELSGIDPLSILKPHEGVYLAAKKHGLDMVQHKNFSHIGSDGSYPWDRVGVTAPDLSDANENLVGGPYEIRQAIILLLVDSGIPDRGHRKTLLNPLWNFVACKEVGQISTMPNCWVQNFAKK